MIIIHMDVWGKSIPGRGNKGVRVEVCLARSQEKQGGRCGWTKVNEGESSRGWGQRG